MMHESCVKQRGYESEDKPQTRHEARHATAAVMVAAI